jgi:NADH:ubiquinone oxidoreductase subunit D
MLDFQCQTAQHSDAYTRLILRLSEIENAFLLIGHAFRLASDASIASMEEGHAFGSDFDFRSAALPLASAFLDAPEGEMAISVAHAGEDRPSRVRIKTPSFALMGALDVFLKGADLDDVILILHTLGINMLEVDR